MKLTKAFLKFVICSIIISLFTTLFSGCSKNTTSTKNAEFDGVLPMQQPLTLKYWLVNDGVGSVKNYSDLACYKELEKRTGIKLEFIHPVASQIDQQFNIMIASREFPDIIEGMYRYPGSYLKAYQDGIILELRDLEKKYAPNLQKLYKAYPVLDRDSQDDQGQYFTIPMIRGGAVLRTYNGPCVRKDWLDELGLSMPTTLNEWHDVLTAFKVRKDVKFPFSASSISYLKGEWFMGAYGIKNSYFLDNGKANYGPYDPRYKEYMATMIQWYKEGLIDPEIAVAQDSIFSSKLLGGDVGACVTSIGSGLGKFGTLTRLVAAPYPTLKKGDVPYMMPRDSNVQVTLGASITASNKYPAQTMALLDYAFTKAGHMLFNFGIEGESYTMENDYPKFTNLVTKNPEGQSMGLVGKRYARSFTCGPFVQDTKYGEQFYGQPVQKEASAVWNQYAKVAAEKNTVLRGNLNTEEAAIIAEKQNEIKNYVDDMFAKWLLGGATIDNFDQYRQQLEKMGVHEVIDAYQRAHDRYLKRFPEAAKIEEVDASEFFWKN